MAVYLSDAEQNLVIETVKEAKETIVQLEKDIRLLGRMGANICPVCAHYNHGSGDPDHCPRALKGDCFEWRGVQHD